MKIMIVDDSKTMRRIVRNSLETMGYPAASMVEACDGLEAIQTLNGCDGNIDIILADYNMPNMDGMTLLKKLKNNRQYKDIPFIMVTGEAQRSSVVEAIRNGARNYVVKPFTPETLRQKVMSVEMEKLQNKKPSDTAIIRMDSLNQKQEYDPNTPFISQLPEELVAGIYENASLSVHSTGDVLIEKGDVVESLHIIERGTLEFNNNTYSKGDCIGETAFLSGDPMDTTITANADIKIISIGKDDFEDLLAEYPHMSFYLTRLLARQASRSAEATEREFDQGLSGTLSMMAIAELVQAIFNSQKTGTLAVKSSDKVGKVIFIKGNVHSAQLGDVNGEEAFYEIVTWNEGKFTFNQTETEKEADIFKATMGLLMEGMRRQDELRSLQNDNI